MEVPTFLEIGKPEDFVDANGNNRFDVGEGRDDAVPRGVARGGGQRVESR